MELLLDRETLPFYNQDLFAKTGIMALFNSSLSEDSFKSLFMTRETLLKEPNVVLSNATAFFLNNLSHDVKEEAIQKKEKALYNISTMTLNSAENGAKKISNSSTLFVHSINNQVVELLRKAKETKKFHVISLEHRPLNYGVHLAKTLSMQDIKVYPDIAVREAISGADICFIGADAITDKGAVCKAGSNVVAELCRKSNIPVYLCAHSWKYDNKGTHQQMLKQTHAGHNVYELLDKAQFTSYVLDIGIIGPQHAPSEIKSFNKWM